MKLVGIVITYDYGCDEL